MPWNTWFKKHKNEDVIHILADLFDSRGQPDFIKSDNSSEFTAKAIRKWLEDVGVNTAFIEPGSPRENGYSESFNGKLRDELQNREIFLFVERSTGSDRELAAGIRHDQAS